MYFSRTVVAATATLMLCSGCGKNTPDTRSSAATGRPSASSTVASPAPAAGAPIPRPTLPAAHNVDGLLYTQELVAAINKVAVQSGYFKKPLKIYTQTEIVCINGSAVGVAQYSGIGVTWCTKEAETYKKVNAIVVSPDMVRSIIGQGDNLRLIRQVLDSFSHAINEVGGVDICLSGWFVRRLEAAQYFDESMAAQIIGDYAKINARGQAAEGYLAAQKGKRCS